MINIKYFFWQLVFHITISAWKAFLDGKHALLLSCLHTNSRERSWLLSSYWKSSKLNLFYIWPWLQIIFVRTTNDMAQSRMWSNHRNKTNCSFNHKALRLKDPCGGQREIVYHAGSFILTNRSFIQSAANRFLNSCFQWWLPRWFRLTTSLGCWVLEPKCQTWKSLEVEGSGSWILIDCWGLRFTSIKTFESTLEVITW